MIKTECKRIHRSQADLIDQVVTSFTEPGDEVRFLHPTDGRGMELQVNGVVFGYFRADKHGLVFVDTRGAKPHDSKNTNGHPTTPG